MPDPKRTSSGLAYDVTDIVPPWSAGRAPIVFHHGIGTDRHVWTDWLPPVVTRHKVVRFDTRGYGASAVPPESHRWTIEASVADLMELVEIAGADRVHLVGESFGGTVALAAAISYPQRVASVTVSNAAFKGAGIAEVPGWREAFARDGMPAWSADMMAKRFVPGAVDAARAKWFRAVQDRSPAHVTAGLGELLAAAGLWAPPRQPQGAPPVLVADLSPLVTPPPGGDLLERVPHAALAMIPGSRHGLPFSHGRECGERLAAHLDAAEPSRRDA